MIKLKLKAAAIHFVTTACVAILAGYLVFFLWYPGQMHQMLRGVNMYGILMGLELAFGPLMSLVIYNPKKSFKHMLLDYSVVGAVQLAALIYGVYSLSISRPIFLVFVKDRIEVISAVELLEVDIKEATDSAANIGWFGPKLVCVNFPSDPKERSDLLITALNGRDIQMFPKYYRSCDGEEIIKRALSVSDLKSKDSIKVEKIKESFGFKNFNWLPVVSRFGSWIAIINDDGKPVNYIDIDPFDEP